MTTILGFLLGLSLGVLYTMLFISKTVGWTNKIVKEERRLYTEPQKEKIEL